MSGIRQRRPVHCTQCGNNGVVEFGMALVGALTETRDFHCTSCGKPLTVESQRAILRLIWETAHPEDTKQSSGTAH